MFRPNLLWPSYYLATPTYPFILQVKSYGHISTLCSIAVGKLF